MGLWRCGTRTGCFNLLCVYFCRFGVTNLILQSSSARHAVNHVRILTCRASFPSSSKTPWQPPGCNAVDVDISCASFVFQKSLQFLELFEFRTVLPEGIASILEQSLHHRQFQRCSHKGIALPSGRATLARARFKVNESSWNEEPMTMTVTTLIEDVSNKC